MQTAGPYAACNEAAECDSCYPESSCDRTSTEFCARCKEYAKCFNYPYCVNGEMRTTENLDGCDDARKCALCYPESSCGSGGDAGDDVVGRRHCPGDFYIDPKSGHLLIHMDTRNDEELEEVADPSIVYHADLHLHSPGHSNEGDTVVSHSWSFQVVANEADRTKMQLKQLGIALLVLLGAIGTIIGAYAYYIHWLSNRPLDWGKEIARMIASGEITAADDGSHKNWTPREIVRRHVSLIEQVGSRKFGDVFKAMLDEQFSRGTPEYTVAAKTVKDAANNPEGARELVAEATVMMQVVGHVNLVSIIGMVTIGDPLILVLQYCEHGSMLGYLKKTFAGGNEVAVGEKMVMAAEIAAGMAHLVQKHLIHRDLAARNVLMASGKSVSGTVCKVADFGLSRGATNGGDSTHEDYYKSSAGVFPVRWTSPEAMATLKFSPASDVWSFGIVVVELFLNGETPYRSKPNPDVITLTMSGGRHEQPNSCDDAVYAVLLKCWDAEPASRPSFRQLKDSFTTFSAPKVQPRIDDIWGKRATTAEFVSAGNTYTGLGFGDENTNGVGDGAQNPHDGVPRADEAGAQIALGMNLDGTVTAATNVAVANDYGVGKQPGRHGRNMNGEHAADAFEVDNVGDARAAYDVIDADDDNEDDGGTSTSSLGDTEFGAATHLDDAFGATTNAAAYNDYGTRTAPDTPARANIYGNRVAGMHGRTADAIQEKLYDVTIPCTTRPMRPGEVNGTDCHFVSRDEFQGFIAADKLK